jgi:hypothetical protein
MYNNDDIIDINESLVKDYVESIRPKDPEIRKEVDISYIYTNKTFKLFQVRPNWRNPETKERFEFAKIQFIKTQQLWKLYWMRSSGKWELYKPFPESNRIDKIIEVIKQDEHACFFG